MWHKAKSMGCSVRIKFITNGLLIKLINHHVKCPTIELYNQNLHPPNFSFYNCGLKCNRIDYSHRVCVWPSGKERKRNVSLWTPYMQVAVICIWGEKEAIKWPNWRGRGVLFWERRADIELRGVGTSCRVVLFWELVWAAELAWNSNPPPFFHYNNKLISWNKKTEVSSKI